MIKTVYAISEKCLSSGLCAVLLIYQRFISPLTGWHCPHAYANGGQSCSSHAIEQLRTQAFMFALRQIRHRLIQCSVEFRGLGNSLASDGPDKKRILIPCVPFI